MEGEAGTTSSVEDKMEELRLQKGKDVRKDEVVVDVAVSPPPDKMRRLGGESTVLAKEKMMKQAHGKSKSGEIEPFEDETSNNVPNESGDGSVRTSGKDDDKNESPDVNSQITSPKVEDYHKDGRPEGSVNGKCIKVMEVCVAILGAVIHPQVVSMKRKRFQKWGDCQIGIIKKLGDRYTRKTSKIQHLELPVLVVIAVLSLLVFIRLFCVRKHLKLSSDWWASSTHWRVPISIAIITCGRPVAVLFFRCLYGVRFAGKDLEFLRFIESITNCDSICYFLYWMTDKVITVGYFAILSLICVLWAHDLGDNNVYNYLTKTCVSFAIASVLLLVKKALLLKWKATMIYKRFRQRILRGGFQLYFYALICGLRLKPLQPSRRQTAAADANRDMPTVDLAAKMKMKLHVVSEHANLYDLGEISTCFRDLALISPRCDDEDEDVYALINRCALVVDQLKTLAPLEIVLYRRYHFTITEATLFLQELRRHADHQVSKADFQKWMLGVQQNSLTLGYTLLDAEKLVNSLNQMMNVAIVIMVVLEWLFVTRLATIKVLAVIASSFLALSFMVGDTCKKAFEGIIFTFVTNPFVIGDKCTIDGKELEVLEMGVMRTKFKKVETEEEFFTFANSELASKTIVIRKEELTIADQVLLELDSDNFDDSAIEKVQTHINRYIWQRPELYASNCEITVTKITNNIILSMEYRLHNRPYEMPQEKWQNMKRHERSLLLREINKKISQLGPSFCRVQPTTNVAAQ